MTPVVLAMGVVVVAAAVFVWRTTVKPSGPSSQPPRTALVQDVLRTARADIALSRDAEARDLMVAYVRANPDDVQVRPLLAQTLWKLGQPDQAEAVIDAVRRLAPANAEALWLKGLLVRARGGSYRPFLQQAASSPASTPDIWSRWGLQLLEEGKDDQALGFLQRAFDAGQTDPGTFGGLGQVALHRKEYDKALKLLAEAAKGDPADGQTWRALAAAQEGAGKTDAAAATLEEAIKTCRDKGPLYLDLGRLKAAANQTAQAAELLGRAANYGDVRGPASLEAAKCCYLLGQYALAMKYIDQAVASGLDSADLRAWVDKIETARFGPPVGPVTSSTSPGIRPARPPR